MIYEIRTYDLKPRSQPEVEKRFGEAYEKRQRLSAPAAFWHTDIGPLDQLVAIAGNLARKKLVPESAGTFPVTGGLFTGLLVSTILIVSALTFFPALSLGPILEHLLMQSGKVF